MLTLAVLLATIGFGIGSALEKATPVATGEPRAGAGETLLGVNPEAVPLIAGAILASLALAAAIWLGWRPAAVLWIATVAMFAFGALDVVEIVHQVTVEHPTLAAFATAVAVLHFFAAILAIRLVFRRAAPETATAGWRNSS